MQIKRVKGSDIEEIADLGIDVALGDTVDVPDEIAGRAPSGVRGDEGFDPGSGLLAQSEKWVLVKAPKAKADDTVED